MSQGNESKRAAMLALANWRYFGKEEDSTGNGLAMLMTAYGMEEPPYAHCLTARTALVRAPRQPVRQWFSPVVTATEGVLLGLQLCGVVASHQKFGGPTTDRCAMLTQSFENSSGQPLLCGPFNRSQLWNRYEGRYSAVQAHFLLILDIDSCGMVSLHDPEGMPFARHSAQQLLNMLEDADEPAIIAVDHLSPPLTRSAILIGALRQTAQLRARHTTDPTSSARGMRDLLEILRVAPLVGSARMALHSGLAFRGRGAIQLASLVAELGIVPYLAATLAEIATVSALALRYLHADNPAEMSSAISRIADLEDKLDLELVLALAHA